MLTIDNFVTIHLFKLATNVQRIVKLVIQANIVCNVSRITICTIFFFKFII